MEGKTIHYPDYNYIIVRSFQDAYNMFATKKRAEGFVGLVFPRSSVSARCMTMANCVGVIDSGYRGEVTAKFRPHLFAKPYDKGDRVAQMIIMPYPHVDFLEVCELSDSDRGEGGYGSTGK